MRKFINVAAVIVIVTAAIVVFAVAFLKFHSHDLTSIRMSQQLLAGRSIHMDGYVSALDKGVYRITDKTCEGSYFLLIQSQVADVDDVSSAFLNDVEKQSGEALMDRILEVKVTARLIPNGWDPYLVLEKVSNYRVIKKDSSEAKKLPKNCFDLY